MKAATLVLAIVQFVFVCKYAEDTPPSTLFEYFAFLVLIGLPMAALFPLIYSAPERRPKLDESQ